MSSGCNFSCVLACHIIPLWKPDMVYHIVGTEVIGLCVRFNLARRWAVFNVCCSCRCQRLQIPLLALSLSPLLTLFFPKYFPQEHSAPCSTLKAIHFHSREPCMVGRPGDGQPSDLMIRSQSFHRPMSDLHNANLLGFLEVNLTRLWVPPKTTVPRRILLSNCPHSASSNSSKLPFKCCYWLTAPVTSAPGKQLFDVTLLITSLQIFRWQFALKP